MEIMFFIMDQKEVFFQLYIDIKGEDEKTPLYYACEKGHLPIMILFQKEQFVNQKDYHGKYVIHYKSISGLRSVVQY